MANEDYIGAGTALLINGEAGADHAWSVEGLTDQNGRVSIQIDLGAAPRPYIFSWYCECQWQATPDQGGVLQLWKAAGWETVAADIDGDIGSTDAALGDIDQRRNLKHFGSVVSENAAASEVCAKSGELVHYSRYLSLVAFNDGGATLNATDSNFIFRLQPKFNQGQ